MKMKAYIASRKGLLVYKPQGTGWKLEKAHFDGVKTSLVSADPKTKNVWVGLAHGHWGPKVHVSTDKGKTFKEMTSPKYPEGKADEKKSVKDIWAFGFDKSGRVYVGTDPADLFYSDDQGQTWHLVESLHTFPTRDKWFGAGTDGTALHSILVDPRDDKHITIGISVAGCLESRDRGKTWKYVNKGLQANYLPDPNAEAGQDPHLVERSQSEPDVLWQQNHCGIFKSEDNGQTWKDLSKAKGVKSAFGWAVVVDETDAKVAYTIPALSDETRVPVKKRLLVQKTTDGGKSWKIVADGLPSANCYDIVYRHAFSGNGKSLLFGTTTGHVFFSNDKGKKWRQIPDYLPPIYSVKLV